MKKIILIITVLAFLLASCTSQVPSSLDSADTPSAPTKPQKAIAAPVDFNLLTPFLPETPAGWEAGEPGGNNYQPIGLDQSEAKNYYSHETGKEGQYRNIKVVINSHKKSQFSIDDIRRSQSDREYGGGSYNKWVTVNGYPAVEFYGAEEKEYNLRVYVSDYFYVNIEASNLDDRSALETVANGIDYDGIKALWP